MTTWKAHTDWMLSVDELQYALDSDREAWPGITFADAQFQDDQGIGIDVLCDDQPYLQRYLAGSGLAADIVAVPERGSPGVTLASCEHPPCLRVLNVAAWLAGTEGPEGESPGVTFVDLALSDASLRRWSLDCDLGSAVVYMRHDADAEWFLLRVSQVTDPVLLRQLNAAVTEELT